MDDLGLFGETSRLEERAPDTVCIKFIPNGQSREACVIEASRQDDALWKIKKRLLKRLKYKNYKSADLWEELRLFTVRGIEMADHDIAELLKQKTVFFSIGCDFDYDVRINALKFQKCLGKGGFGEVHMCLDEVSNELVAVKYLNFAAKQMSSQMIKKEVEALTNLKHKHIVTLIDAIAHSKEKQLIVVMEYLAGGELYEYWKRFPGRQMPENEVAEVMLQLAHAVDYCHNHRIIHRDLKF